MNVKRIVDAAEWNWLVEIYGIEPTLYETYRYSPGSALAKGVNDPERLMQIAEWASNPKVLKLWAVVSYLFFILVSNLLIWLS